jgi:hypothetical protein
MSNLDALVELIGDLGYGDSIPHAAIEMAASMGAVIVYGYSDDGVGVEGAADDQGGAYGGNTLWLDREGFLPINEDLTLQDDEPATVEQCRKIVQRFDSAVKLKAIWADSGIAWRYEVGVEHRNFEIIEDGEVWCEGVVFLLP